MLGAGTKGPPITMWAVLGLVALSVGVAHGRKRNVDARSGVTAVPSERPECPHDTVAIRVIEKGNLIRTISSVPASGPITNIPEFHDCQRFIVERPWYAFWKPKRAYDSLYAIFAAFRLDSVPDTLVTSVSIPVATIYSYGGTYSPLGIRPGFNCLFLTPPSTNTKDWTAEMVSVADSNCLNQATLKPYGTPTSLEARRVPMPVATPFTPDDYPAAARWDWGTLKGHGQQYIGIRCGRSWCEVGAKSFKPSGPYTGPAAPFMSVPGFALPTAKQPRVTMIKGWYDAQTLDVIADGKQVPSPAYGVLIPNSALDILPADNVAPGLGVFDTWVHVANAWLSADYKWNLTQGMNQIWLCRKPPASAGTCAVPMGEPALSSIALSACWDGPDGRWWAKIVSSTGKVRYQCVRRRSHLTELQAYIAANPTAVVKIPGTARWRWLLDDAGEWTKCATGCCTGQ